MGEIAKKFKDNILISSIINALNTESSLFDISVKEGEDDQVSVVANVTFKLSSVIELLHLVSNKDVREKIKALVKEITAQAEKQTRLKFPILQNHLGALDDANYNFLIHINRDEDRKTLDNAFEYCDKRKQEMLAEYGFNSHYTVRVMPNATNSSCLMTHSMSIIHGNKEVEKISKSSDMAHIERGSLGDSLKRFIELNPVR